MRKAIAIFTILFIVQFIGYFYGLFSIFFAPLVITVIGLLLMDLFAEYFKTGTCILFILLILNDLLTREFAGGTHDNVGRTLCNISFLISYGVAIMAVSTYYLIVLFDKNNSVLKKISDFLILLLAASATGLLYWTKLSNL